MRNIYLRKAPGRTNYEVVENIGRDQNNRTKRKYTTTGTSDKVEAEAFFRDYVADKEKAEIKATVASVVDAYLKGRQGEVLYPKALIPRVNHLKRILKRTLIRHVDEKRCNLYMTRRRREGVSDGTIRTELSTLSAAMKWAERRGFIERAPYVFRPPASEPRDRWLKPREWELLMKHCPTFHVRLFLIIAINTAARSDAILDLTWDRVDEESSVIDFRKPGASRRQKGRSQVPMTSNLRAALSVARERAQTDYVIEWAGDKVGSVKKAIARARNAAGLPDVSAHTLRHTAASWMIQKGVPVEEVAAVLAHSDCRITQKVYAKHSPEHMKKAAEALQSMQGSQVHL